MGRTRCVTPILYGLAFYLLSSLLYFAASGRLKQDWRG
jgi:hypothetical protein